MGALQRFELLRSKPSPRSEGRINVRTSVNEKFAAMIDRHCDGIASYCRPESTVILGLVKGLNNKTRFLQRHAYRYRDEGYLTLKIIAAFLPLLTRGAEQHPL